MASNETMVELWNSDATSSWVRHAERYDGMLDELGRLALSAAALRPGARVLDVGCGAGALSLLAADDVGAEGSVVGVDISAPMLALARQRAARSGGPGRARVEFVQADAQVDELPGGPFDAVVSRFGVMFFADPVAAFANLLDATAPGGRLAFVAWQGLLENEWAAVPAGAVIPHVGMPDVPQPGAPGPFGFADGERIRSLLTEAGWADVAVEGVTRQVAVAGGAGVDEVVDFFLDDVFGRTLLGGAEPATQEAARAALHDALAARAGDGGVILGAAVWLATAARTAR